MGLFSGVLGGSRSYPNNEPEAVLGMLIAIIAADGSISDDEKNSFMYLANNTKALGPMPAKIFWEHVETSQNMVRREGAQSLMEKCVAYITAEKRKPLFINACDLIMKDGRVEPEEEAIIEGLQRRLGSDDAFAQNAVSVILTKYSL